MKDDNGSKKMSLDIFIKIIELIGVIVGMPMAVTGVLGYISDCKDSDWERQQEKESHMPEFDIVQDGTIPLKDSEYQTYTLKNTGESLTSGSLCLQAGIVILYDQKVIVKQIMVEDAFYSNQVFYQTETDQVSFWVWSPDSIKYAEQTIQQCLDDYMENHGNGGADIDLEIELCVVGDFDYVTTQNKDEEGCYLFILKDGNLSCERYEGEAYFCYDQYHITRENIMSLQGEEEFQKLIEETGERLIQLMDG